VNAPIKILLGVNLLRHLHPTFDFTGGQFVVRSFDPPPPPVATTVKLSYVRGGGMLLRAAFGADQSAPPCSLLLDTALTYPVALDTAAWKKAGVEASSLRAVPGASELREGVLPMLRLGAFDIPRVPGLQGDSTVKEREDMLGIELDGLIGAGLLSTFRVTLVDGGRTMWLEDLPAEALNQPSLLPPPEAEGAPPAAEPPVEEPTKPAGKPGAKAPALKGSGSAAPAAAAPPPANASPPAPAKAVVPAAGSAGAVKAAPNAPAGGGKP
jgi:hypothetical protein